MHLSQVRRFSMLSVVILMQENRSFDHALGTLRGVRGVNDPRAMRLPNGNSVFVQTDARGNSYAPWRLDIKDSRITWMGSIPHSRNSQVDAWNEGRNDGWIEAKRSANHEYSSVPMTMGITRAKICRFTTRWPMRSQCVTRVIAR